MRLRLFIGVLSLVLVSLGAAPEDTLEGPSPAPDRPGEVERAALGKADFLVGEWEGEGWSLNPSGERNRFWVREVFRYRGDRDLMDMEGRFGDILADGTRTAESEYGLGFLFFDRASGEYRMWHYSNDGTAFTVRMDVDVEARAVKYTRTSTAGTTYTFSLKVGADGLWISRIDVPQPDGSWRQIMEFRMTRVG